MTTSMMTFHLPSQLSFRLKDLSTYRSELMGWSILWIMMLHFRFITLKPLGFLAQYGFAGVDIFMFVSGLGIYYSLEKDSRLDRFYLKRLKRIFPVYYFVGIFASLFLFSDGLPAYLFRYTTLGFWTGGLYFEWYIPSIIVCYLFAPVIRKLIQPRLIYVLCALLALILLASYLAASRQFFDNRGHFFFLYRTAAFIGGMLCGWHLKRGGSTRPYLALLLLGLPFFAVLFPKHHAIYEFKYLSLLFLLPASMLAFSLLSKLMGSSRRLVALVGNASLEIYLIQVIFFHAIIHQQITVPSQWHDAVTISLIVFCSLAGILLHHLFGKIQWLR